MAMGMQMNETHTTLPREVVVVLGRSEQLSRLEIETTLKRSGRTIDGLTVTSGAAIVKAAPMPDTAWFRALGGARLFGVVEARLALNEVAIAHALTDLIGTQAVIGLSQLGGDPMIVSLARTLKREIASLKRYLLPSEGTLLSPVQSRELESEWLLVQAAGECLVVRVAAHQDIDEFTRRDRSLPVLDMKRGMLPTKLARMMANIALGDQPLNPTTVVLDPFCGTGRLLIESLLLGSGVLGADIDPAAIVASVKNLTWAADTYHLASFDQDQLFAAPIDKVASLLSPASLRAVATEPFLGPPALRAQTANERDERFATLAPQYEALLRASQVLLEPGGRLVAVFPLIGDHSLFARFVDRLHGFGYHLLDSIPVTRSDQWIARDIVVLEKQ